MLYKAVKTSKPQNTNIALIVKDVNSPNHSHNNKEYIVYLPNEHEHYKSTNKPASEFAILNNL